MSAARGWWSNLHSLARPTVLMGRGRGKVKKVTTVPNDDDLGAAGVTIVEVVPAHKRRGRPTKPLKDDLDEEVAEKIERDDEDDVKPVVDSLMLSNKGTKAAVTENGKKRRRHLVVKEKPDASPHEENGDERFRFAVDGSSKLPNGCCSSRPNGNRRKSKPRRAAEVGVECRLD